MNRLWIVLLCVALGIGGCAGLSQFPEVTKDFDKKLQDADPDYRTALEDINNAADDPNEQERIRNEEIERRLRVIDLNFNEFQTALAQENVQADFGIGAVEVAVGGAGALVSETASQILSAVSGGLAGVQAAYAKAALFDQTFSALLAQMIASRNSLRVTILENMQRTYEEYPLSRAVQDIEAYYFAGSLPGAVIATSADAKVKNDEAEDRLAALRVNVFGEDESGNKIRAFIRPPDGAEDNAVDQANLQRVREWLDQSPIAGLPIANFLTNPDLRALREQAIREIPVE